MGRSRRVGDRRLEDECFDWREIFDDDEPALLAAWTRRSSLARLVAPALIGRPTILRGRFELGLAEESPDDGELSLARAVRKKTVVPYPYEAPGEDVEEEAADELPGLEGHHPPLLAVG